MISPITGTLTLTNIWSKNQNVNQGDIVATVIPLKETEIIGKLTMPTAGAGKVKPGQKVNIKLDNFPYKEYGMIQSKIKIVSKVPVITQDGAFYIAEVEVPDSIVSNYGLKLSFTHEMTGTAEIITDDIRLLERLFNPLKALLKKHI
ncbi:MAG: HlyD family efflux transporter periplasmic adaptor subunit [Bacteroidales bacterium]